MSTRVTVRAHEELLVEDEARGVHPAHIAVPLDPPDLLVEPETRVLPSDLDQVRPDPDDVVFRDHANELSVVDDCEPPDLALGHHAGGLGDLLTRLNRHD